MIEEAMTEDEMQSCLRAGDLPGTPAEVNAIERAFACGKATALACVLSELDGMASSMSAYDAAVDMRQVYERNESALRAPEPAPDLASIESKPSRQVRRAEERLSAKQEGALAKMNANAERAVFGEEQAAKFQRMRTMLFAIVKQLGRVRLTQHDLNAIEPRAGLDVKVQPNGDLVVTFLRGRDR